MWGRLAALDGLRALSVAGVIVGSAGFIAPFGWIGVLVFYVLSGFLITQILLEEKARARDAGGFFRRFYYRRTLRIFPLYLAYVALVELCYGALAVPAGWPDARPYALTYTVSFGIVAGAVETGPAVGHLWTLSVEEQFYIVWPLLVWLMRRAQLGALAVALIVLGPFVRLASARLLGWDTGQIYVSTFSHLDAFACGAVLAVYDLRRVRHASRAAALALGLTLLHGLAVVAVTGASIRTLGYREGLADGGSFVWGYTLLDVTAALVILAALRGEVGFLSHRVLAYVGRVSYGVYLFQRPAMGIFRTQLEPYLAASGAPEVLRQLGGALLVAAASTALAALSYRYLEQPILSARDRKVPARSALPEPSAP